MNDHDDQCCARRLFKPADDHGEAFGVVSVFSAVNCTDRIRPWRKIKSLENIRLRARAIDSCQRCIMHDIADGVDTCGNTFLGEIVYRGLCRTQQERAEVIGDDSIDFFRHAFVEGAKPCLDMRDRNVKLGRGECARRGGVGVAIDQYGLWLFGQHDLFEPFQHSPGHCAVAEAVDLKIVGGRRNLEFVKKDV